jgi:hypothetical protein
MLAAKQSVAIIATIETFIIGLHCKYMPAHVQLPNPAGNSDGRALIIVRVAQEGNQDGCHGVTLCAPDNKMPRRIKGALDNDPLRTGFITAIAIDRTINQPT